MGEEFVRTICGFCHTSCGMVVSVKNGVIDKVKGNPLHTSNEGVLCPKGLAVKEIVYSPDRLKYPLKKANSGFKRISWDEALGTIADRLNEIKNKFGPQSLIHFRGAPVTSEAEDAYVHLTLAFGSPNTSSISYIWSRPRVLGLSLGIW